MAALWSTLAAGAARLSTAQPLYVLAVLSLYVVSVFITGARWRGFLRALGSDVTVVRAGLATLGGIAAGNVTPSRVGTEPCRATLLRLTVPVSWTQLTLATAWDRLSEVPPVAVLVVMSAFAVRRFESPVRNGVAIVAALVALGAVALAARRLRQSRGIRVWIDELQLDRITPRAFAAGVWYSSLLWIQDIARLICAGLAVGVHLSPTQTAALAVSTIAGGLVPSVGGLVVVEGGLVAALLAFGVDTPTAVALTTVERAISYGFSTIAGGVVIVLMGGRPLVNLALRGWFAPPAP